MRAERKRAAKVWGAARQTCIRSGLDPPKTLHLFPPPRDVRPGPTATHLCLPRVKGLHVLRAGNRNGCDVRGDVLSPHPDGRACTLGYRRSTAITTNRVFKDWPKVFPDALNAQVIAERLTERAEHFVCDGKGYRPHANV